MMIKTKVERNWEAQYKAPIQGPVRWHSRLRLHEASCLQAHERWALMGENKLIYREMCSILKIFLKNGICDILAYREYVCNKADIAVDVVSTL